MALDQGDEHQPAAGGLDLRAADDLIGPIVASLDQHIGTDRLDQFQRRVFVEDGHGVDGLERAARPRRGPRPD